MSLRLSQTDHDLIVRIYDTVLHQDSWPSVLDRFSARCSVSAATLMLGDMSYPEIQLRPGGGAFDAEFLERYYAEGDLSADVVKAMAYVARFPARTWISDEEAWGCPWQEIDGNIYIDRHKGIARRHGARLNDSPVWWDGVSLNYTHAEARDIDRALDISRPFLPHMAKALEISRPFLILQARFNAVLSVLNKMRIGVAIVTGGGDLIVANNRADDAFQAKDGLSLSRDKRLVVGSPEIAERYRTAVSRIAALAKGDADAELIAVPRRGNDAAWLLEIVPLTDLQGDIGRYFSGAAVFIIDPARDDAISTSGMKEIYGLTEAEADVCQCLASGLSVAATADRRGTSVETTRSQIKALFAKTGVNSQPELVRLALQVNLPVEPADD